MKLPRLSTSLVGLALCTTACQLAPPGSGPSLGLAGSPAPSPRASAQPAALPHRLTMNHTHVDLYLPSASGSTPVYPIQATLSVTARTRTGEVLASASVPLVWTSSDLAVVQIDDAGRASAVGTGSAVVSATHAQAASLSATVSLTVHDAGRVDVTLR